MSAIRFTDEDIYVGTRVEVQASLFNRKTRVAATALAPELTFRRPDGTIIEAGNMIETPAGSGVYFGSAVVDAEGRWRIEVRVGPPLDTLFRNDELYVSP